MGLFWRRRKIDNTAAAVLSPERQPVNATVHNHATNWPAVVATAFFCFLVALWLFWHILVFLFEQLGSSDPAYQAAWWLIYPLLGTGGAILIRLFVNDFYAHKERLAESLAQISYNNMLIAGTNTTPDYGRDRRKAAIIKAVMAEAFRDFRDSGGQLYANGTARPWSKREAVKIVIPGLGKISQTEAAQVRDWLIELQMIHDHKTNSQLNLKAYPTYQAVVNAVDARYKITLVRDGAMMESDGREFYEGFRRG